MPEFQIRNLRSSCILRDTSRFPGSAASRITLYPGRRSLYQKRNHPNNRMLGDTLLVPKRYHSNNRMPEDTLPFPKRDFPEKTRSRFPFPGVLTPKFPSPRPQSPNSFEQTTNCLSRQFPRWSLEDYPLKDKFPMDEMLSPERFPPKFHWDAHSRATPTRFPPGMFSPERFPTKFPLGILSPERFPSRLDKDTKYPGLLKSGFHSPDQLLTLGCSSPNWFPHDKTIPVFYTHKKHKL